VDKKTKINGISLLEVFSNKTFGVPYFSAYYGRKHRIHLHSENAIFKFFDLVWTPPQRGDGIKGIG